MKGASHPRPVANRTRWAPQEINSAISALSLMLGKPNRTSPSGTTSAGLPTRVLRAVGQSKSCDTFAPLGPFLATTDEIQDLNALGMWLALRGTLS